MGASDTMAEKSKLDLAKMDKAYYSAPGKPQVVEFPELSYLAVEGQGSPDGQAFASATEALYKVAYTLKFQSKGEGADFTVAKLEGQWWVDSEAYGLDVPREEWRWKLLIRLPEFVSEAAVGQAKLKAAEKKNAAAGIPGVEFLRLREGLCVQMLHTGPFSNEPETLEVMHGFMAEAGYVPSGRHHEIYLSDFRRTEPSRLRTILRQPVQRLGES
ncbi:GyrI-like domain-containing protein [Paenibacillus sp. PL2-23]|uniref:GyrI-like domain-containing protein n=1 Tax=Paenibacillus sp. PL2-23 TaxID=2100729 RepID=UPI0030F78732